MDANEPAEHNTLINDEESEHTMLLGRGINQQQYKGNRFQLKNLFHLSSSNVFFDRMFALIVCFIFFCSVQIVFDNCLCFVISKAII